MWPIPKLRKKCCGFALTTHSIMSVSSRGEGRIPDPGSKVVEGALLVLEHGRAVQEVVVHQTHDWMGCPEGGWK
jgi:hypothetical protein